MIRTVEWLSAAGRTSPRPPRLSMNADSQPTIVRFGELCIDRLRFEAKVRNTEVRLTRKEFEILWILASECGRVCHREELIRQVWGADVFVRSRTVDVHITRLRKKLNAVADSLIIETVWGIGYHLKGPEAAS
jgi:DNA-binding response OmpR family regulator